MKKWFIIFLMPAFAVTLWADDAHLVEARRALDDGLPQVAIFKLRQNGKPVSKDDKVATDVLLGRALIAAGRYDESVAVLEKIPAPNPPAVFWLAEAYAALGQPEKAIPLYHQLVDDPQLDIEAVIGEARMYNAMHQAPRAAAILKTFLERKVVSNRIALELAGIQVNNGDAAGVMQSLATLQNVSPENRQLAEYLGARAEMISGDYPAAAARLKSIQDPPADLAAGVAVSLAECSLNLKDSNEAERILEQFIEENSRLPGLPDVFAALDRVYAAESAASGSELRNWSNDPKNPVRAALAKFYHARNEARSGLPEKSRQLFDEFLAQYPGHALTNAALAELATSHLAAGQPAQALAIAIKGQGPRLDFLQGQALSMMGKYKEAAAEFLQAAELSEIHTEALTNSAICGLIADVPDSENAAIKKLRDREDSQAILERIQFLEALHKASQRKPGAGNLLGEIADGTSPWAGQARLALAEWDNLQLDLAGARAQLRRISSSDPAQKEREEYLAVFLADNGDQESESLVGTLASDFLKNHPQSPFEPEVRLKLGEMLYRRGDFLGARAQFALVAENFPDSALAEKAAFLSGQALARSMNPADMEKSLEIFDEVAKAGGPLALRARLSQAMLLYALKRPKDALGVFDSILAAKPEAELRAMTLTEKGDTLFALGAQDPANYRQAIAAWKEIASDPAAGKNWSYQAFAKMGAANEKLGANDAALDCYYSVFSRDQKGEPEYFWYYKAGFDAGRLLESQKLWKEAIAVYDKIASIDGPRAEEARERVNKLRLENFIWEN
ncbi:MAG: tetratricopeptide repeat protein [Terrimicrobiaceae bacterium]